MTILDLLLARRHERLDAIQRAGAAIRNYGDAAEARLREKLDHPERKRSRRTIRLAIREVRRQQHRPGAGGS